jgi:hypothetical protein
MFRQMETDGLQLRTIVLNRLLDERSFSSLCGGSEAPLPVQRASAGLRAAIAADSARDPKIEALANFLDQRLAASHTKIEAAAAFARELPARIELVVAPEFEAGLGELAGIKRVADVLVSGGGRKTLANALKLFKPEGQRQRSPEASVATSSCFRSDTQ